MRLRCLTCLLLASSLAACLVPIPLEQVATSDGGQILEVTGANPAFGTQRPTSGGEPFIYEVDVISDSPSVAGRLYAQLNGSCCDLDVDDRKVTYPHQSGTTMAVGAGAGATARYTINFPQVVRPCTLGFAGTVVYLVPVLASGGFQDGPNGFRPEGNGVVDRSHYWTVICP